MLATPAWPALDTFNVLSNTAAFTTHFFSANVAVVVVDFLCLAESNTLTNTIGATPYNLNCAYIASHNVKCAQSSE